MRKLGGFCLHFPAAGLAKSREKFGTHGSEKAEETVLVA
jgi:hypothetical protein